MSPSCFRKMLMTLGILVACASMLNADTLKLRAWTQVTSSDVKLGEILEDSSSVPEEVSSLVVKSINRPGVRVIISLSSIRRAICKHGFDHEVEAPDGKMFVKVEVPVMSVEKAELSGALEAEAEKKLGLIKGQRLEIDWSFSDLKLPEDYEISLESVSSSRIQAVLNWEGRRLKRISGTLRVLSSQKVCTASSDLKKGAVITEKDISEEEKFFPEKVTVPSREDILGKEVTEDLASGSMFRKESLKIEEVVSKGQKLRVCRVQDQLTIELSGVALNSGGVGDVIKVKGTGVNHVFTCRIIDRNTTRIL